MHFQSQGCAFRHSFLTTVFLFGSVLLSASCRQNQHSEASQTATAESAQTSCQKTVRWADHEGKKLEQVKTIQNVPLDRKRAQESLRLVREKIEAWVIIERNHWALNCIKAQGQGVTPDPLPKLRQIADAAMKKLPTVEEMMCNLCENMAQVTRDTAIFDRKKPINQNVCSF